jgi:hypothetical protein
MIPPGVSHPLPQTGHGQIGKPADGQPEIPAPRRPESPAPNAGAAPQPFDLALMNMLLHAIRQDDSSIPSGMHADLILDQITSRVAARIISTATGEVVRQYPPAETLRLLARARQELGNVVKADA